MDEIEDKIGEEIKSEPLTESVGEEEIDEAKPVIYELGFLIVPQIAEEVLPETVSAVKETIESAGGIFISDSYPQNTALSYTMIKSVDGKKEKYDQAYFGWIKFEIPSSKIAGIEQKMKENDKILRFIIIKTVRENTLCGQKIFDKKERPVRKNDQFPKENASTSEEIDKSIEKLVTE